MRSHGTVGAYKHGCSCDECGTAYRARFGGAALPHGETREDVLAKVEAEHGKKVAAIVAADWDKNRKGGKGSKGAPRHNRVNRYRRLKRSTIPRRRR